MEMIGVSGVIFRPQRVTVKVTTLVKQLPHNLAACAAFIPFFTHRKVLTVGKTKSADIQRVRRGVLAAPSLFAVIDITAGITTDMIDTR